MSRVIEQFSPLAQAALKAAKRAGAQAAQVGLSRQDFVECGFRDGALEKATASTKQGLSLRLYLDGRFAVHQTSDLRPAALDDFVGRAAKLTRELEPDPLRGLPEPGSMAAPPAPDLDIYDEAFQEVQAPHWIGLAKAMENALEAGGKAAEAKLVSSQGAVYGETAWELMADSRGFVGHLQESAGYVGGSLVFLDHEDEAKRRMGYWYELSRELAGVGSQEQIRAIAAEAVQRASWQMGARPGPSGKFPVVVENRVAGKLISQLIGSLGGQAVQQKRSCLAGKLGQQVAAPILSLTDEPLMRGGLASRWFDSEGMAASPLPLVADGVLNNYYLSTYYAKKLEMQPTTGGSSNVVLKPSVEQGADGLCAGLEDGLFITGFLGGNFNSTTGDFSYGVSGRWIKDGRPAFAVEGMNLSGNALSFWNRLSAVGNDAYDMSQVRTPSLRFEEADLSGE